MPSCEPTRQSAHSRTWAACQPACQKVPTPEAKPRASARQPRGSHSGTAAQGGLPNRPHPGYHLLQSKVERPHLLPSGPGMAGAGALLTQGLSPLIVSST